MLYFFANSAGRYAVLSVTKAILDINSSEVDLMLPILPAVKRFSMRNSFVKPHGIMPVLVRTTKNLLVGACFGF